MACLIVPAVEAVVVTGITKIVEKKEHKALETNIECTGTHHTPFSKKLKWLSKLQFGGAALLLFEHVWHGEITPFFPFLTAMGDKADTVMMLKEMATTGVAMALLTTLVWVGMVVVTNAWEKNANKAADAVSEE